ncbi:class I SAM-dependent methyltransferase [Gammaproteobacteria bacterium]|jgi:ubiquinone/menaquinone biosynthesis C-methylase UbiE|nr:class I SAM-dependent methyltransferase [Gammaproteobacteria bacterium]
MNEHYNVEQLKELEEGWWFYDHAWSLLHLIINKISGKSLLDVGCGSGLALSVIKAINPERSCTGIEPTNDLVNIWKLRNVDVKNGSATKIPFDDNEFDTVYSSHVIEHIEDDLLATKEMIRVAKQKVLIIVPAGNCDDKNMGTPHLRYYNRVNFKELIDEATSGIKCDIFHSYHSHSHINSLVAEILIK